MKISKKQKSETRRLLIQTAVTLFSERGYDRVTMAAIAEEAGIGSSTIYKYFPNKDKFLFAYHDMVLADTVAEVREYDDLDEFNIQEKLQLLFDCYLENLMEHREFVQTSINHVMMNPLSNFKQHMPAKDELKSLLHDFFNTAVAEDELPTQTFQKALVRLIMDSLFGTVLYWLQDESDEFADTTKIIDLSLGLLILLLRSGLVEKMTDLVGFLIKSQFSRLLEGGKFVTDIMSLYQPSSKRPKKKYKKTQKPQNSEPEE